MLGWRPPRRLRHVAGVIGRGLDIPSGSAAFFSISAPVDTEWKLVYCSEPIEGTVHPEWSPLPPMSAPRSPVEIFIAIHVVLSSTIEECSINEGHERKYRKAVVNALKKKRGFVSFEEEIKNEEGVVVAEAAAAAAITKTTSNADATATPSISTEDENDKLERLKETLVAHLEDSIPGKVSAAYFIKFNELFSLGQHSGGGAGAETGLSFCSTSAAAAGDSRSISIAANTNFLANTLIFDFFDGQYGAFPWPLNELQRQEQKKTFSGGPGASSAAASIAVSEEPSPFPSPTKLNTTALMAEEPTSGVLGTEENTAAAAASGGLIKPNEETAAAAAAASPSSSLGLGLGSMLMSRLLGSAPTVPGDESTSGTATPTNFVGGNGVYKSLGLGGGAKLLPLDQLRDQIESLVTLQARIRHLSSRCKDSQARIDTILEQQAPARQQHAELLNHHDIKIELTRRHKIISQRNIEASKRALLAEKSATVTVQALISTLQALQSAYKKISAGEMSLKGEEGRGRLAMALKELIARRCLMTVQLGWILRLGPASMRLHVTPPGGLLDAQLERQWAGSGSGGVVGQKNNGGSMQEEVRLAICGLSLDSSVWAHAFDPGGYDWDPVQDKAASVALGHSALLIEKLAEYLGIVLRYPIIYRGSVSVVMDNHPQAGTWKPEIATGSSSSAISGGGVSSVNFLFGRAPAQGASSGISGDSSSSSSSTRSSTPAAAVTPVEYPLYCLSNKERPKFAVGVFLLNKNAIQLLQAHGISAAGPSQLLQNLHKLVAAAQSGIPQGLGSGYWK